MNHEQSRSALLAAVSMLGLSLGVGAAHAAIYNEQPVNSPAGVWSDTSFMQVAQAHGGWNQTVNRPTGAPSGGATGGPAGGATGLGTGKDAEVGTSGAPSGGATGLGTGKDAELGTTGAPSGGATGAPAGLSGWNQDQRANHSKGPTGLGTGKNGSQ